MIGLVLITHGRLAEELLNAMQHVVGAQQHVRTICIAPDDYRNRRDDILHAITEVNTGQGVLILTDMFGGTPSNLAISVTENTGIEVLTGVNLPMLVKLAHIRHISNLSPTEAALIARDAGRKYMTVASELLNTTGVVA